jgi:hypothetical protein
MRRLRALMSGIALAATGIVAGPTLLAQSTASSTKASIQRTADGHPDLSGMYDVSTMAPLQPPAEFGNRRALTKEEAAEMEQYEKQRQEKNAAPSSPNREAPPVGGDTSPTHSYLEALFRFGGGVVGGCNTFWISPGDSFAVVHGEKRTSLIIDPPDGHEPQMKAEARTRNAALRATGAVRPDAGESAETGPAGAFDGPELRPLSERCLLGFGSTSGPPSLPNYWYNNLKQVVQTKDSLMLGDSVGHWEGDVLVVDTTNFTAKTQFEGSGEHLHVVERFSRLPDGNLLYQFTVDDPTTWDRAWSGEYPWRATAENLYEYACHEGNYALSNVLSGARQHEKEQAASTSKQP